MVHRVEPRFRSARRSGRYAAFLGQTQPAMPTSASVASLTRIAPNQRRPLHSQAIQELAQHLSHAITSATEPKRSRSSRSACAHLAVQVLVVAAGLRRAALVDALALSVAQASAVSLKLASLTKHKALAYADILQYVRLLYHVPTAQTFLLSTRQSLWAGLAALSVGALPEHQVYQPLWLDVHRSHDHPAPTLSQPDPHITSLIVSIHQAITSADSDQLLIAPYPLVDPPASKSDAEIQSEARLVGVALAGFLLEYGAIYCLHDNSPQPTAASHRYHVRPLSAAAGEITETHLGASPPNCLGSQPLSVYRVLCSNLGGDSFDLLSFSVPRSVSSDRDLEHLRQTLTTTFQTRLADVDMAALFGCGQLAVEVASVTLHQVAL